jgi:adenylate cyclase
MGIEIERKFVLHHEHWAQVEKPEGEPFLQGYLMSDTEKTIRVRVTSSKAYHLAVTPFKNW